MTTPVVAHGHPDILRHGIEVLDSLEGLIAMSCPKLADLSQVAGMRLLRNVLEMHA